VEKKKRGKRRRLREWIKNGRKRLRNVRKKRRQWERIKEQEKTKEKG
jgi:hypothetical protein